MVKSTRWQPFFGKSRYESSRSRYVATKRSVEARNRTQALQRYKASAQYKRRKRFHAAAYARANKRLFWLWGLSSVTVTERRRIENELDDEFGLLKLGVDKFWQAKH